MSSTGARSADPAPGPLAERALLFELAGELYGLRLAAVDGLGEPGAVSAVPGAPPAVLGLVEWRGRVLTLLDLPLLIDRPDPGAASGCDIRLAPPLERTALRVPAAVRLGWVASEAGSPRAERPHALHVQTASTDAAESPTMLEPGELIRVLASCLEG